MKTETLIQLQNQFEALKQSMPGEDIEFWFARDLMEPLGYARWENFQTAIRRAIESCETTGFNPENHFRGVTKMVKVGSGAERPIEDFLLTRYACYLIAQNGDPRKEPIAFAQSYFAIQTRRQELIEDRMRLQARLDAREKLRESEKTLSQNIYERGVDDEGFGRIRSKGDAALFGGHINSGYERPLWNHQNQATCRFFTNSHNRCKKFGNRNDEPQCAPGRFERRNSDYS